jgi:hypothetical protein
MKRPKIDSRWNIPAEPLANSLDVERLRSRLFYSACPCGQRICPFSILTPPVFFAIMPEFRQAHILTRTKSMIRKSTNRIARKVPRALLEAFLLFVTLASLGVSTLHGQSPQTSCSDKPQAAAATPAATPSPATQQTGQPQTDQAKGPGLVWVNTDTRVYHKQGTRWYGKTRHGKYMLEADAIKAGYKPAK